MSNSRPLRFHGIWRAMGIGMVMIVSPFYAESVVDRLRRAGESPHIIGRVVRSSTPVTIE